MVLIDSNLTPAWVEYLQTAEIEAVHWWRVGKGDAPDTDLLEWATEHDATILTGDGDFSQLLALRGLSRPSVIFLRTLEQGPKGPGEAVKQAVRRIGAQRRHGAIVTIDDSGGRFRPLPIKPRKAPLSANV